jgi:hypothetical protein
MIGLQVGLQLLTVFIQGLDQHERGPIQLSNGYFVHGILSWLK